MKTKIYISMTILILVAFVVFLIIGTANASNPNSERIAELSFQISELNYAKIDCLNNLNYKETKEEIEGTSKHCVQFDEEIMGLQAELDELQDYENYESESEEETTDREPGMLNESGTAQEMPTVSGSDSHEKFKSLAEAYGLDAGTIRNVENYYGIKEGVILCITVAETSGGNRGYGASNIGSVGSNDRGDRPTYALLESGLEDIGKTLTNKYLGSKQTLGCLSNAGSCSEANDNGKRYATSTSSRENNMTACLSTIYGSIDPATFNIRR